MDAKFLDHVRAALSDIKEQGLLKTERPLAGPQGARMRAEGRADLLNLCANNYLGFASHPDIVAAAKAGLERWGFGLSSVRFICGTQDVHLELEARLTAFLATEATILYGSCFDANGGLFETLLGEEDAVISDELNHASIIDGVRLCKAKRLRYKNRDLVDLEARLKEAEGARFRLIATDGVFSMDGTIADLAGICDLADQYRALVMVDDSHAVGVLGAGGRGSLEHCGVLGRVDLVTGTLGKALGGASGGYTSGRKELIELLRQRSRPYLFSNTLPPAVACGSLKALELLASSPEILGALRRNTAHFRAGLARRGFRIREGEHPIVPVMLGEAPLAQELASRLYAKGVYVSGFFYPVVPKGQARIRTQVSASHGLGDLDFAVEAFAESAKEMGIPGVV